MNKIIKKFNASDFAYPSVLITLFFVTGIFITFIIILASAPDSLQTLTYGLVFSSSGVVLFTIISLIFFQKKTIKYWVLLLMVNIIALMILLTIFFGI